jgi:small subunit ribosomal protein S18
MPRIQRSSSARKGRSGRSGGARYMRKRRPCAFCVDKGKVLDYKESAGLRRFISEQGKIEPRRRTGTCARHQRALAQAIKRGRHLALLPYTAAHLRIYGAAESSTVA